MSDNFSMEPREQLEAQVTALLLGQLTSEEAAAVRQALAADAGLARLYFRLERTIELVRQTETAPALPASVQPATLKLSEDRRAKLLQQFKTVAPPQLQPQKTATGRRVRVTLLELAAVLVILGMLAALLLPSLSKAKSRSHRFMTMAAQDEELSAGKDKSMWFGESPPPLEFAPAHLAEEKAAKPVTGANERFAGYKVQAGDAVLASTEHGVRRDTTIVLPERGKEGLSDEVAPVTGSRVEITAGIPLAAAQEPVPAVTLNAAQPEQAARYYRVSPQTEASKPAAAAPVRRALSPAPAAPAKALPASPPATELNFGKWALAEQGKAPMAVPTESQPVRQETVTVNGHADGAPLLFDSSALSPALKQEVAAADTVKKNTSWDARATLRAYYDESAGKGETAAADQKLPVVGDMPVAGRLFRSDNVDGMSRGKAQANVKASAHSSDGDIVLGVPFQNSGKINPVQVDVNGVQAGTDSYGLNVVGYAASTNSVALITQNDDLSLRKPAEEKLKYDAGLAQAETLRSAVEDRKPEGKTHRLALLDGAKGAEVGVGALKVENQAATFGGLAALADSEGRQKAVRERVAERPQAAVTLSPQAGQAQPDAPAVKPAVPPPVPQPEVQTRENAFSTFSLNVSDVSFKLAGASLEKGNLPEPASIRAEEFINAFDYRDPEPAPGAPLAFAWERSRYPFAQNRDLLRFSVKTAAQGRQAGRPLNLVLLLDNSGSMERADRVNILREALRVLAGQLQPQDKLSVVTFSRTARLWVDGIAGNQAAQVADAAAGLTPQGGTNLEEAMNLGYETALRHYLATGINRVVLLTDGAANLGDVVPENLKQKVEAHRKQGIALDCFGIGWEGYNDDLLEVLARNGDGRYGFLNSPEEASTEFAAQLAGALKVAASDVKVQVEFNPARVSAYRQVGYAKHQLTKEQFRDNTVDAAEIGAAESGNALYVVEVNPAGQGPLATVRVRYKVPGTTEYHEHAWEIPYTGSAPALDQSTPALRLAATAAAFAEWLASSPFAAEVTPDALLSQLRGVADCYGADGRPKKLEWMIRQAKSLGK